MRNGLAERAVRRRRDTLGAGPPVDRRMPTVGAAIGAHGTGGSGTGHGGLESLIVLRMLEEILGCDPVARRQSVAGKAVITLRNLSRVPADLDAWAAVAFK